MKIDELMIGDHIIAYNQFKIIRKIDKKKNEVYCEESITSIEDKDIHPIPITSEILEKNGFKEDVHNCSIFYDWSNLDGDDVTLRRYPCGYFELHITDNENLRNVRFPIDYVHELQHALRLCGIDKEIEL